MSKQNLRQEMRQRKKTYGSEQLRRMSQPIIETLLAHPRLMSAHTILLYASLADEVNTHELINTLLQQGKTLLLPVVVDDHTMKICRYTHDTNVGHGSFGIMEPQAEAFTDYEQIDLILVPGMAFDRHGHRLGRGKGYYDRLLPRIPAAYKAGICFPFQIVEEVPAEAFDICMDIIITSNEDELSHPHHPLPPCDRE